MPVLFGVPFSGRNLIFSLAAFLCLSSVFAVAASAQDLEEVQRQALKRSFVLKIAEADKTLSEIDRREAWTLYLPTLALRYDFGYAWALDGQQGTVTIGDAVSANDLSVWRNSLSASLNMLLYDGGAREAQLTGTRHGLLAARLAYSAQYRQVKLQVLDAYLQVLQTRRQVKGLSEIAELYKRLFRVSERLQTAGTIGLARLQQLAMDLAENSNRLDDARIACVQALEALSELTGEAYGVDSDFAPLSADIPEVGALDVATLPSVRKLDEDLAKLRAERQAAWRRMLPSLGLYGNYRFYGSDPDAGEQAIQDMNRRDATLAVVAQWQFSALRDRLQVCRLDAQIERLGWQRRQRIAELEREIGGLRRVAADLPQYLDHQRSLDQALEVTSEAGERLRGQGVLDEAEAIRGRISRLESELDRDRQHNRRLADALRLRIWSEEQGS